MNYNVITDYLAATIGVFIVSKHLNIDIQAFFLNGLVVFMVASLFVYKRSKNVFISVISALLISIVVSMITIDDPFGQISEAFGVLIPSTDALSGCSNVKVTDLVSKFGSETVLKQAMVNANVPYNISLNDDNASIIATYLLNGKTTDITSTCKL